MHCPACPLRVARGSWPKQGRQLVVVVVAMDLLRSAGEADMAIETLAPSFGGVPVVLMAQEEEGSPHYYGAPSWSDCSGASHSNACPGGNSRSADPWPRPAFALSSMPLATAVNSHSRLARPSQAAPLPCLIRQDGSAAPSRDTGSGTRWGHPWEPAAGRTCGLRAPQTHRSSQCRCS